VDPRNIHALIGMQKLHEDQRQWREAYEMQTRLSRLRKTDDSVVLGHLQTEIGREAARAGNREGAERAFRTALSLDRALPGELEPRLEERRGPAAVTDTRAAATEWADLLLTLPPAYRSAVVLRHVDGLSYPELAIALDRPEGTVKAQVHRGLALLRTAFEAAQRHEREEMTA